MMTGTFAPTEPLNWTSATRLLTAADVAALPDELPTGPVKYELFDGRLVVMAPPGDMHGDFGGNAIHHLKLAQGRGHGKARSEVGVILRRNPDRLVGPDACFIANASLPLRRTKEGYLETIPDLVVEVRSKNDSIGELASKAGEYLAAGVKLVWVIDPLRSLVTAYVAGHPPRVLQPDDELTAEGIIPDFRVRVSELLAE